MITVISGTNRSDSKTFRLASIYYELLLAKGEDVRLLSLIDRTVWERGADMLALEAEYLLPAKQFIFIMPEYNASFPGILKVMMDNSDIKKSWWHKKAALVGLSDGRAGNIRGLEHMTAILHYMKVNVLYNKILLSKVGEEIDADGNIIKPATLDAIKQQIDELLSF